MSIPELTHDDVQDFEIDNITHHGRLIDQRLDYDGPTVTIELPVRAAFDLHVATSHLLETWADDECKDDPYMRHAMCFITAQVADATKAADDADLDAIDAWSRALDEIREVDD